MCSCSNPTDGHPRVRSLARSAIPNPSWSVRGHARATTWSSVRPRAVSTNSSRPIWPWARSAADSRLPSSQSTWLTWSAVSTLGPHLPQMRAGSADQRGQVVKYESAGDTIHAYGQRRRSALVQDLQRPQASCFLVLVGNRVLEVEMMLSAPLENASSRARFSCAAAKSWERYTWPFR